MNTFKSNSGYVTNRSQSVLMKTDNPLIFMTLALMVWILGSTIAQATEGVQRGTFSGAKETEMPDWFKQSFLDFEEDIDEATAEGKRLMLFYHQAGCPYCNALVEDNLAQPDIEKSMRENIDVVALNLWGDLEVINVGGQAFTEKTLAEALQIKYTPTLIFFDESRKVALRIDGYYPPDAFRTALQFVVERKDKELSFADYQLQLVSADGNLNQQPYFEIPPFDLSGRTGTSRPIAVYFEKPDCESCDILHQKVLTDETTANLVRQFENVQLNINSQTRVITPQGDATTARDWASDLGVKFTPTVVLFDRSGEEVFRIEALFRTFHTQSIYDYVASGAFREEPNFQRYLTERSERFMEQGIDVDIWDYRSSKIPSDNQ